MEYLQLFDDNKKLLNDSVERSNKLNIEPGKYYMVVLIFIENNNKFLIQKTSIKKDSVYATTGGHVIYGYDGIKTCFKEVYEELGFRLDKNMLYYIDSIKSEKVYCEIYYTKQNINLGNLKLQSEEVESVKWLQKQEIYELINNKEFRESNIRPFEKVLEWKKRNKSS